MRVVMAAFFFLLQLQPLVGAAVCLHGSDALRPHCEMAEQEQDGSGPGVGHVSAAMSPAGAPMHECALAAVCAPSAPAVVQLATHLDISAFVHDEPVKVAGSLIAPEPSAPPLPPPRA